MNKLPSRYIRPLLLMAVFAMLAALWGGWLRLGWKWPILSPSLPLAHGPLMVSGFLGTLIGVERAVALRKNWSFLGPLLSGIGGVLLVFGNTTLLPPLMITMGSLGLVITFAAIVKQHLALYTVTMALGAVAWFVGNLFWLFGWPIFQVVLWWAGFLVLTIAGERLELGRLARLSRQVEIAFLVIASLYLLGLVIMIPSLDLGTRISGIGMIGLTIWLLRYDISRKTIRQTGLPRYAAICLLSGYVWLGAAGVISVVYGALIAGALYDAMLHTIFLGFAFSMIFGHAPIIFPAVLGFPVTFHPRLYFPLVLLHLSLVLRIVGDLAPSQTARLWGGLFNGIAILIFFVMIAYPIIGTSEDV